MAIHDVLPICSLSIISRYEVHIIPEEVGTADNTGRKDISIQAGIMEHVSSGDAWTHLAAHPFHRILHWPAFPTPTPLVVGNDRCCPASASSTLPTPRHPDPAAILSVTAAGRCPETALMPENNHTN